MIPSRGDTESGAAVHPMDMALYKKWYGTPAMRAVWTERQGLAQRLRVEAELAAVQAELGIIPSEAAAAIVRVATTDQVSVEEYADAYETKQQDVVALVSLLAAKCGEWGEYVHWGATSQDIVWTALALQLKDTYQILLEQLSALEREFISLIDEYAETPMLGRTHGQIGNPVTFGFVLSLQAMALRRGAERLLQSRPRVLNLRMNGALSTSASFGVEMGRHIRQRLGARLDLSVPLVAESEATRDNVTDFGYCCDLLLTTCEKVAHDVFTLQRAELGEVSEGFEEGTQVGSSTLAHKRNPFTTAWIKGVSTIGRAQTASLSGLYIEDMRDGVRLAIEYAALPSAACMTSGVLRATTRLLSQLVVHEERMLENLKAGGLIVAEPVMLLLADVVGRQRAHGIVYRVAMQAREDGRSLADALDDDAEVQELVRTEAIGAFLEPDAHWGDAPRQALSVARHLRENPLDRTWSPRIDPEPGDGSTVR